MVKIRQLQVLSGSDGVRYVGDEYEIDAAAAQRYVAKGIAEIIQEPTPAAKPKAEPTPAAGPKPKAPPKATASDASKEPTGGADGGATETGATTNDQEAAPAEGIAGENGSGEPDGNGEQSPSGNEVRNA